MHKPRFSPQYQKKPQAQLPVSRRLRQKGNKFKPRLAFTKKVSFFHLITVLHGLETQGKPLPWSCIPGLPSDLLLTSLHPHTLGPNTSKDHLTHRFTIIFSYFFSETLNFHNSYFQQWGCTKFTKLFYLTTFLSF